jgi:ribonucleoside-diphosphate reductase alpha chain
MIPFAKSLVDYIFRWMGMEFIPGYREANAPQRKTTATRNERPSSSTTTVKEDAACSKREAGGTTSESNRLGSSTVDDPRHDGGRVKIDATPALQRSVMGASPAPADGGPAKIEPAASGTSVTAAALNALEVSNAANAALMGDAPACDNCGAITVRNGSCYKCMNCGNSMGCS